MAKFSLSEAQGQAKFHNLAATGDEMIGLVCVALGTFLMLGLIYWFVFRDPTRRWWRKKKPARGGL